MNYQHSYHAGSPADVFKHSVLIQLLAFLQKKPAAMCYMETHAAEAIYDLRANPSQKTGEYKKGIAKLWPPISPSPLLQNYLAIIQSVNPSPELQFYPGSGLFAKHCLREQDEAILCELHPGVYEKLYAFFKRDPQIHMHHRNGYEALTALLPPKEKRGLVLIDPPFEATDEFEEIINAMTLMHARWSTGVYAIWYPIKQYEIVLEFYRSLKKLGFQNVLAAECWTDLNAEDKRLKGSGILILNTPWKFEETLSPLLLTLKKELDLQKTELIRLTH